MSYEEMEKEFGTGKKAEGPKKEGESNEKEATTAAAHSDAPPTACPLPTNPDGSISSKPPAPPEDHQLVYHLCRKQDWEDAKESQRPYFPRTFLRDGKFTRASLYLDDIAYVANEYYSKASSPDEKWIVLEIDVQFLYHGLGIAVLAAIAPESVDKNSSGGGDRESSNTVQCLQIFGGISTHPSIANSLVKSVYSMKRRDVDGKFIGMLAEVQESIFPAPASPHKPLSPKTANDEEVEVGDIELDNNNDATKTKKKKKGFFSKLKNKK